MKRKALALMIFTFAATTGCTSNKAQVESTREPSSLVDPVHVDTALSEITGSFRARSDIESLMLTIANVYFRGQDYLREFDEELASGKTPNMMTSLIYAKLQSARLIRETAADKIVDRYEDLLTKYWEALDRKANVSEIKAQLNEFRRTVEAPTFLIGGNRIALQGLVSELSAAPMRTYTAYYGQQKEVPAEVASLQDFKNFLFKDSEDMAAFVQDSANMADMKARVAEALNDRVIQRNLVLMAPFMQLELQANLETRKPQSISPSTAANGNLNGGSFPSGTWALTFDDGPSGYTVPIVNNLKDHGIKATFFWLAKMVTAKGASRYITLAKSAGMDLNNHSYTHANLVKLGGAALEREIITSTAVETQAYGTRPRFFRCPYGSGVSTFRVRDMIARQQMIHVFWNVDSLDWQDHNPSSIVRRTLTQMSREGRGIILFHDIHPQSVTASNVIMGELAKKRAVTMTQIINELNGK